MTCFKFGLVVFLAAVVFSETSAQVHLKSANRLTVDARYDAMINDSISNLLAAYRLRLGADVSRQIGVCSNFLSVQDADNLLPDFLCDLLLAEARQISPSGVDIALINLGSIRSPLRQGPVKVSDLYKVMPFENELVLLDLRGKDVKRLFRSVAKKKRFGFSNVSVVVNNQVIHRLLVGGEDVKDDRIYRIATMDYLADGNSGMSVLLHSVGRIQTGLLVRDVFIKQIEALTAEGKQIAPRVDDRYKILIP